MGRRPRLDRLEGRLAPTAAVCRWLEEAHAFGSAEAYIAAMTDRPRGDGPVVRIGSEVRGDVLHRLRGQPTDSIASALDLATRAAHFRIALVFELNEWTTTALHLSAVEGALLLHIAYFLDVELGDETDGRAPQEADLAARTAVLPRLVSVVAGHAISLRASAQACTDLERRYLGGHAALFPDLVTDRQRQLAELPTLVDYARDMPDATDSAAIGLQPNALGAATRTQAAVEAAARVDEARIKALGLLGEHGAASRLAGQHLRALLHGGQVSADATTGWPGAT